jgi:reactive intermediate/imine deaminase
MKELQHTPAAPLSGLVLPFSACVRWGDLLFVSGQLGHLPGSRELAPGGVAGETRQAMANLGAVLKAAGAGFADVVKVTVMLADMADWQAFNAVYLEHFDAGRLPARSAFASSGLALGARLELEAIAVVREG